MTDFMIDHTPAAIITPYEEPTREELSIQINTLQREVERLTNNLNRQTSYAADLALSISNAAGVIRDYISENGEVTDELKDIAEHLGVALTKEIAGTATIEISWTATVPMDFDADDLEISYTLECDTYDAEDFDYNEDNMDVSGEDV